MLGTFTCKSLSDSTVRTTGDQNGLLRHATIVRRTIGDLSETPNSKRKYRFSLEGTILNTDHFQNKQSRFENVFRRQSGLFTDGMIQKLV